MKLRGILKMMIGLPGSGKSRFIKQHRLVDEVIVNSINTPEELEEVKELLKQGKCIYYDDTNTTKEHREYIIKELKPYTLFIKGIFVYKSLYQCYYWNSRREGQWSYEEIHDIYKNFNVPTLNEGFDSLVLEYDKDSEEHFYHRRFLDKICDGELSLYDYHNFLKLTRNDDCIGVSQNSIHHTLSIDRHMYTTYKKLIEFGSTNQNLLVASLLHDIGKVECIMIDKDGIHYHFPKHENVSAYLSIDTLNSLGMKKSNILEIAGLIQNHMTPINDVGKLLHLADREAR
jgi:predicted kinase